MKFKLATVLIVLSLLFITCKHDIWMPGNQNNGNGDGNKNGNGNGGSNLPPPSTCSPDTVYFANSILPLLTSNCAMSGCHDATTHREGLILNSYAGIMRIVQPGNALQSALYQVINGSGETKMPPKPYVSLSSAQIQSIKTWINQGANNNACTDGCDTTLFTYFGAVQPIMTSYCQGCHNASLSSGGVDLSNYSGVQTVALNGKLIGTITHAAGYPAMPQGGSQLPDCQILQIEKWIQAGALNN
jgi:Planctomycete cytochrome C